MMLLVPAALAVTTPVASTVATAVFDDVQATVLSATPASALTDATNVSLSPTFMVAAVGVTVTPWTCVPTDVEVGPTTLTLSPQAVRLAMPSSPTKLKRNTRCILPPW